MVMQVCFGYSHHDVVLYRYTGLQECKQGETADGDFALIRHDLKFSRSATGLSVPFPYPHFLALPISSTECVTRRQGPCWQNLMHFSGVWAVQLFHTCVSEGGITGRRNAEEGLLPGEPSHSLIYQTHGV